MNLEGIMLSEISQRKTNTYDFTHVESKKKTKQINKNKLTDTENRLVVTRGEGGCGTV